MKYPWSISSLKKANKTTDKSNPHKVKCKSKSRYRAIENKKLYRKSHKIIIVKKHNKNYNKLNITVKMEHNKDSTFFSGGGIAVLLW